MISIDRPHKQFLLNMFVFTIEIIISIGGNMYDQTERWLISAVFIGVNDVVIGGMKSLGKGL